MRSVAVVAQKGGSGKTTLCVHLATSAERHGQRTLLVDLDPQGSAMSWGRRRAGSDAAERGYPALVAGKQSDLTAILKDARSHFNLVVLDTPPHSDAIAAATLQLADLTLIPCRPSAFDLDSIGSTLDLAALSAAHASVVINPAPVRGSIADELEADLRARVSIAPVRLHQRIAYSHAVTNGRAVMDYEPGGRAANVIERLYRWLMKTLKGANHHAKKVAA